MINAFNAARTVGEILNSHGYRGQPGGPWLYPDQCQAIQGCDFCLISLRRDMQRSIRIMRPIHLVTAYRVMPWDLGAVGTQCRSGPRRC